MDFGRCDRIHQRKRAVEIGLSYMPSEHMPIGSLRKWVPRMREEDSWIFMSVATIVEEGKIQSERGES